MIRAFLDIVRGEGLASAMRRTAERIDEAADSARLRARALWAGRAEAVILNVSATSVAPRTGGVAVQLTARLAVEAALRNVALLHPGGLRFSSHSERIRGRDFVDRVRRAMSISGARALHFEGTSELPLDAVLRSIDSGTPVVVSIHDFSLFCARPHLLERPSDQFCFYSRDLSRCAQCLRHDFDAREDEQAERRARARHLLQSATGVIFPSAFLLQKHRELFGLPDLVGEVIEPASPAAEPMPRNGARRGIAFAGSLKLHKGARMLAGVARSLARKNIELHLFGGGDLEFLRELRRQSNVRIHGYYRAGTLPSLLAQHNVGLVVLPSIWPETYSIVLSEAWAAGASVAAFDLGAPAERIRGDGGGWLAPLESGVEGLVDIIDGWIAREGSERAPFVTTTPTIAAQAHVDFYRRAGLL